MSRTLETLETPQLFEFHAILFSKPYTSCRTCSEGIWNLQTHPSPTFSEGTTGGLWKFMPPGHPRAGPASFLRSTGSCSPNPFEGWPLPPSPLSNTWICTHTRNYREKESHIFPRKGFITIHPVPLGLQSYLLRRWD